MELIIFVKPGITSLTNVQNNIEFNRFYDIINIRTEMFFFIKDESCDGSDRTVK